PTDLPLPLDAQELVADVGKTPEGAREVPETDRLADRVELDVGTGGGDELRELVALRNRCFELLGEFADQVDEHLPSQHVQRAFVVREGRRVRADLEVCEI